MDYELMRNGSGYVDITAYKAIQNYQKGENEMEYKRGEIFEYSANGYDSRKALVVSANFRSTSRYVSVIVLADEIKGENMVPIVCGGQMYADCGMVCFCTSDRLGNYLRSASAKEMEQVDAGLARYLGIGQKTVEKVVEVPVEKVVEVPAPVVMAEQETSVEFFSEELIQAKAEANVYKNLYEQLLARMLG